MFTRAIDNVNTIMNQLGFIVWCNFKEEKEYYNGEWMWWKM